MWRQILRRLAYFTLALTSIDMGDAVAGMSGGALSASRKLAPVQTVQSGDCWYDNGWNGPGYYTCGDEWNSRPEGAAPVAPIVAPFRRRHRHGVVVAHPHAVNRIHPAAPSVGPRAGAPAFGGVLGPRRFGAVGARVSPNLHPGASAVAPGSAGIFHSGASGNFHRFHNAGPHIGPPVSPRFTGSGGFHLGAATGISRIATPASPGLAGAGTFHPRRGAGAPRIAAPPSPSAGVHGVGAALGQGAGHR